MPPLAELHLHLDGSVEPETLLEIDPSLTREEIAANTEYTDFAGFLKSFVWVNKRLRTPEDYARVARRLFERLESEGVTYAEVILSAGVVFVEGAESSRDLRRARKGSRAQPPHHSLDFRCYPSVWPRSSQTSFRSRSRACW